MLQSIASQPYRGNAPGGGAAQGTAQLVAALLAKKRQQALLAGNPSAAQNPLPVQQQPPAGAQPPGATPSGMGSLPMAQPGYPAQNPQALPQPVGLPNP